MKMKTSSNILLTRDNFRKFVFDRDLHQCVFCESPATAAHHILDRKLFLDGGYYLNNGASVCDYHHWECEKTNIDVTTVRNACGIVDVIVPDGYDPKNNYDKWGNIILDNGTRIPGKMFYQENVQKILKPKLYLFITG